MEGDLKSLERLRTMALQARAATEASVSTLLQYYAQVGPYLVVLVVQCGFVWVLRGGFVRGCWPSACGGEMGQNAHPHNKNHSSLFQCTCTNPLHI